RSTIHPAAATASAVTTPARTTRRMSGTFAQNTMSRVALKHLLKRGALLAAANWQTVAIQFVAQMTFQVLLAVPIIGAAILVAVLLGADLAELLQGSLREMFATVASTLMSGPVAAGAFITAVFLVLPGGSVRMV